MHYPSRPGDAPLGINEPNEEKGNANMSQRNEQREFSPRSEMPRNKQAERGQQPKTNWITSLEKVAADIQESAQELDDLVDQALSTDEEQYDYQTANALKKAVSSLKSVQIELLTAQNTLLSKVA